MSPLFYAAGISGKSILRRKITNNFSYMQIYLKFSRGRAEPICLNRGGREKENVRT